ncbi:MAG: selenide, water dikinase SelD [Bacteroidia bacterium]
MEATSLMSFSKGSGCGCKIQPAVLREMLGDRLCSAGEFEGLVLGNETSDDCSVFDLGSEYLLQTVDFFTPLVNDPFVFGQAAAANALSDIYAMGGQPLMANALFSWPLDALPMDIGKQVLEGGRQLCAQQGVALAGGHSIDGKEPLYGLSVTGRCEKNRLKTNAGAQAGDRLFLSKPLGIGMLSAAHKRGLATADQDQALFAALTQVNDLGRKLSSLPGLHAMTDVTGFGLLGHLMEMLQSAQLMAELQASALPKLAQAESLAASFVLPDNAMRNWNAYESQVDMQAQEAFPWIVDPQTNGGLLIAVAPELESQMREEYGLFLIGELLPDSGSKRCRVA